MICLNNYIKAIDSSILSDNYFGRCTMVLESNCKDQLCRYKISGIKNIEISISRYCNYNCKKCSVHSNISDKFRQGQ